MADDGKRTEMVSLKITERMALTLLRMAALEERSISDYLYKLLRQRMYGDAERLDELAQMTKSDKVDRSDL